MGSDFTNLDAGCHGPVPFRGLFPQPDLPEPGRESTGFSISSSEPHIILVLNNLLRRRQPVHVVPSSGQLQPFARGE